MTKSSNPWVDRYREVASLAVIRERSYVAAIALAGLDSDPIEVACERLKNGLERIFVPTEQVCAILLSLIEMAIAHAEMWYADPLEVCARCYEVEMETKPVVPICLTGLDGVGKSALLEALKRILPPDAVVVLPATGDELPLIAMRLVNVRDKRSVRAVQTAIMRGTQTNKRLGGADNVLARWMYRRGCCLLALDELQFMTQSEKANVLVSQVLLSSTYPGVPLVFNSNYSLCRRLLRRPPESRKRMLTRPIVLMPDPPDSEDWRQLLGEYQRAVPGIFDFSFAICANELWSYTAGRKRDLVDLLVKSYHRARRSKRASVSWETLVDTYHSIDFSASRHDVEALMAYAVTGDCPSLDLVCPFEGSREAEAKFRNHLRNARNRKVADAANDSAISVAERKVLASIKKTKLPTPIDVKTPAKKGVRRGATTADELSRNARFMLGDLGRRPKKDN